MLNHLVFELRDDWVMTFRGCRDGLAMMNLRRRGRSQLGPVEFATVDDAIEFLRDASTEFTDVTPQEVDSFRDWFAFCMDDYPLVPDGAGESR